MPSKWLRQAAIGLAAWLPFFALWMLFAATFGAVPSAAILLDSLIAMGTAGVLGIAVWLACRRWPWPLEFRLNFYLLQVGLAIAYAALWTASVAGLEFLRGQHAIDSRAALVRELAMGVWLYAVLAGLSHAVQTRSRLHEKETRAIRAEALAAAARLDALRARLNPHFLFNALHTLMALVRLRPTAAQGAIEQLGDMLRYTLKEDGRGLVTFGEEFEFTRQYLAFEQLRFDDRLNVEFSVDPRSFDFDLPPFCIQALAENAVRHAVSTRPEGGSIWIASLVEDGVLRVTVRDDGPGDAPDRGDSHQLGLRSVRERLHAAFGSSCDVQVTNGSGFEAAFVIPMADEQPAGEGRSHERQNPDRG